MDEELPVDVLANIFKYLPVSNAARFERLSKRCAEAIRESKCYFDRPNIHVKVTLSIKGVAFEVFEDYRSSFFLPKCNSQRIHRTFIPQKDIGVLESIPSAGFIYWIKRAIFKDTPSLRSTIRDITQNVNTLYEKWGPRKKVFTGISTLRIVTKSPCPGLCEAVANAFAQENTLVHAIYVEFRTFAKCMPIELYTRTLISNAVVVSEYGISSRLFIDASCLNIFNHYIIFSLCDYFLEVTVQCLVSYNEMLATLRTLREERIEELGDVIGTKPWNVVLHCYIAKFPIQRPLTCLEEESVEEKFVIKVHKTGESRDYDFFTLKLESPPANLKLKLYNL